MCTTTSPVAGRLDAFIVARTRGVDRGGGAGRELLENDGSRQRGKTVAANPRAKRARAVRLDQRASAGSRRASVRVADRHVSGVKRMGIMRTPRDKAAIGLPLDMQLL